MKPPSALERRQAGGVIVAWGLLSLGFALLVFVLLGRLSWLPKVHPDVPWALLQYLASVGAGGLVFHRLVRAWVRAQRPARPSPMRLPEPDDGARLRRVASYRSAPKR